jgi:hypothetical protein
MRKNIFCSLYEITKEKMRQEGRLNTVSREECRNIDAKLAGGMQKVHTEFGRLVSVGLIQVHRAE